VTESDFVKMTSERIKKRLHISGLTTKITIDDIVSRFESFGTVSDTTGFGQLNAVGTPRPFAFLTLETSKDRLARCLASLSGTTWKGARLRVGEARPDWKERSL
jgi:RNA recognition motif-containing protein